MRPQNFTLTARQVHGCAASILQDHLKLPDHGPKCRAGPLLTPLFYAAARMTSLSDACQSLRDAPSDEAARLALIATLPDFAELQRRLNAALAGNLPRPLRRRPQRLAADLVLIPYHGRPLHDPDEIYRSAAKSGTSHFHAYATLYVNHHGYRFTVALTAVACGEPLEEVLKRLLRQARRRRPLPLIAAGPRLLQRGGDPISPGGPPPVPDARDLPGPPARRSAGAERDQRVLDLGAERLRHLHPARCPEAIGAGLDLHQVPLLPRSMAPAWPAAAGLRLLGFSAPVVRLGAGDVSPAVRHRDDLSAVASGADPDLDAQPGAAAVGRRDRLDLAERLGVVAPRGAGPAPPRQSRGPLGLAAIPEDAVVVGACGGGETRRPRLGHGPTSLLIKGSDSR